MNPEPILASLTQRYLQGEVPLAEVLEAAEKTRQSLEQHRDQTLERLRQEPEHVQRLIQGERVSWEESVSDFLRWAQRAQQSEGRSDSLESVAESLPTTAMRLQFDGFRLEQALWVARGPSSLGHLNRVVAAYYTGFDLAQTCQFEAEYLNQGAESLLESYPESLREDLGACLDSILQWLEDFQPGPEWLAEGERLGREWSSLDYHFLVRGYSSTPSPFEALNLAVNACWLQEQGLVQATLTCYCLEQALESMGAGAASEEGDLSDVQTDLQRILSQMLVQCRRGQELKALREAALDLIAELQAFLEPPTAQEVGQPCPVCGSSQPLGITRCGACGSRLLGQSGQPLVADRLETLLAQAELLLSDSEASDSGLIQGLELYQADLKKARELREPEYDQILDDFEAGLRTLSDFLQDPDRQVLEQASQQLRQSEARLRYWRERINSAEFEPG